MSYGINPAQLRELIVQPVLKHLELHTLAAENLVVGTALVESNAGYLAQIKGPAFGLWQMEPATHDDVWKNFLAYRHRLSALVKELELPDWYGNDARELAGNLYYAAAMCRVHYYRVPERLPEPQDAQGMAQYWKTYYNTHLGAGSVLKAIPHFEVACL